jgi:hypothetical protein
MDGPGPLGGVDRLPGPPAAPGGATDGSGDSARGRPRGPAGRRRTAARRRPPRGDPLGARPPRRRLAVGGIPGPAADLAPDGGVPGQVFWRGRTRPPGQNAFPGARLLQAGGGGLDPAPPPHDAVVDGHRPRPTVGGPRRGAPAAVRPARGRPRTNRLGPRRPPPPMARVADGSRPALGRRRRSGNRPVVPFQAALGGVALLRRAHGAGGRAPAHRPPGALARRPGRPEVLVQIGFGAARQILRHLRAPANRNPGRTVRPGGPGRSRACAMGPDRRALDRRPAPRRACPRSLDSPRPLAVDRRTRRKPGLGTARVGAPSHRGLSKFRRRRDERAGPRQEGNPRRRRRPRLLRIGVRRQRRPRRRRPPGVFGHPQPGVPADGPPRPAGGPPGVRARPRDGSRRNRTRRRFRTRRRGVALARRPLRRPGPGGLLLPDRFPPPPGPGTCAPSKCGPARP